MTPERWAAINDIFHSVLDSAESPTEERVWQACGGDEELFSEVRRMLLENGRPGFFDQPVWEDKFAPRFEAGDVIASRYRIERYINRGGMGEVYEAHDLELNERLAIKTLLPGIGMDPAMVARFKRETQLARRIPSSGVCRVFDLVVHSEGIESIYFLTMELLPGETLTERLKSGPVPVREAISIVRQVADALDAAHTCGIVHRDLKPSNIMLVPSPAGARAVITDFGLARSSAPGLTATHSSRLIGTLHYMAPELLDGQPATPQSDIYALGMIARKVFGAESTKQIDDAVARATGADAAQRFGRAGDFAKALEPGRIAVLPSRRIAGIAVVAVMVVVLAAALAWRYSRSPRRHSAGALTFYNQGVADLEAGAYYAATKAFAAAIQQEPSFALAHARLAESWVELQSPESASTEMLLARRDSSLPERERIEIDAIDRAITREYEAAVAKYEQLRKMGADVDIDLGRAYERSTRIPEAIASYRRAAEGVSHNPAAWLRLGVLYSRRGQPQRTEAFDKADQLYKLSSNLEGLTELAFERGVDANRRSQFPEGAMWLQTALQTARLAGNPQQEVNAMLQLATNAYRSGNSAMAEQYATEGIRRAQSQHMEVLAVSGMVNLGNAYRAKQEYAKAETIYRAALGVADTNNAYRMAATCQLSLAGLYDQMSRPGDAAREARESLKFYESAGYASEESAALTLIGRNQRDHGDYKGARQSFERVLAIAEKSQDVSGIASAHASLGRLLFIEDLYPQALEQFRLELAMAADEETRGYAELQAADALWRLGHYEDAAAALARAEKSSGKFSALALSIVRTRAEMALSEALPGKSSELAQQLLSRAGEDIPIRIDALRILCLAALQRNQPSNGRQSCGEALELQSRITDPIGYANLMAAVLALRVAARDRAGATEIFTKLRPIVESRPESLWRLRALLARVQPAEELDARTAFFYLSKSWPAADFEGYLSRPDIHLLARPFWDSPDANH